MKRSGVADLPLHGGRVPRMARDADGHARHGDRRERRPPLRPAGAAVAPERSLLVPGARQRHGHGLAFVRHHHLGDGRAQAGPEPARRTSLASTSAAAAAGTRGERRTSCATSRDRVESRRRRAGRAPAASPRASTTTRSPTASRSTCTRSSLTQAGDWAVVQQGMNEASAPRAAVSLALGGGARLHRRRRTRRSSATSAGTIQNLVDRGARPAQDALLAIAREPIPIDDPARACAGWRCRRITTSAPATSNEKRLGAVLALAHERDLRDFASFLLLEQLGPRTLQSLALVAEVVHGTPTRFDDPARFSFAHGGKDGHPFPVPLKVYDESIAVLRRALDAAKVGRIGQARRHGAARSLRPRDRTAPSSPTPTSRRRSPTSGRSRT